MFSALESEAEAEVHLEPALFLKASRGRLNRVSKRRPVVCKLMTTWPYVSL